MASDDMGRRLHDRATRGETLSADEKAQLDRWYAEQDRAESDVLRVATAEKTVTALQAQVDAALAQLAAVTKRIQEIAAENEALRQETAALRRQLAQLPSAQPA